LDILHDIVFGEILMNILSKKGGI